MCQQSLRMPTTSTAFALTLTPRGNVQPPFLGKAYFWTVGGKQRTWRKPTQTLGEHANSSQNGLQADGASNSDFLAARQQILMLFGRRTSNSRCCDYNPVLGSRSINQPNQYLKPHFRFQWTEAGKKTWLEPVMPLHFQCLPVLQKQQRGCFLIYTSERN